jgi:uncharacterized membrane protein YgdD (TMEM256/DUF423 family)
MSYRIWLFLAGLAGGTAVMAAAYGAHGLNGVVTVSPMVKIYDTATLYHALHAIALALVAALLAATYFHIARGIQAVAPVVPAGGIAFIIGWGALALSALGLRRLDLNQPPS